MKKILCVVLALLSCLPVMAAAAEDKPVWAEADGVVLFPTDFKVVEPGKEASFELSCPGYKSKNGAIPVSIRLEDGTEIASAVVKAAKTKLHVTLPADRKYEPRTALYLYHKDQPSDARYVAVIDNDYEPVRGNYERDDKMIALTFDCAYGEANTLWLLDTLQKYNAHATFFTVGTWIGNHVDPWINRMLAEGHELGNHTTHHPRLTEKSYAKIAEEISDCANRMAEKVNGYTTKSFRPPYGSRNKRTDAVIRYMGYEVVLWEVESGDARNFKGKQILNRVLTHVKPGDIILMHNAAPELKNYLEPMLEELSNQGYTFGSVSELMNW